MATFRVYNLSGTKLAVPPPLGVVLLPGRFKDLEAVSVDSSALMDLQTAGKVKIVQLTAAGAAGGLAGATVGLSGGDSSTTVGALAAPVVLTAGQTMTLTHSLGAKAEKINVYNSAGRNVTAGADLTILQATVNALTVQSTAGGSFVVEAEWGAGVTNPMGSNLAASDSRIGIA